MRRNKPEKKMAEIEILKIDFPIRKMKDVAIFSYMKLLLIVIIGQGKFWF